MRQLFAWGVCLSSLLLAVPAAGATPKTGRILKVLPHLLDAEGRSALAPSLFQRDAYQARLRKNPELVSTVRYDVNCQVIGRPSEDLRLRLTLRTALRTESNPLVLETKVKRGFFGRSWQSLQLDPQTYQAAGKVIAWRIELLQGETEIGTQQSFLW